MKTIICPHCKNKIDVTAVTVSCGDYNPDDPIQRQGYDDQAFNETEGKPSYFRKNEYPDGSDEYYRWNRGARARMG